MKSLITHTLGSLTHNTEENERAKYALNFARLNNVKFTGNIGYLTDLPYVLKDEIKYI